MVPERAEAVRCGGVLRSALPAILGLLKVRMVLSVDPTVAVPDAAALLLTVPLALKSALLSARACRGWGGTRLVQVVKAITEAFRVPEPSKSVQHKRKTKDGNQGWATRQQCG